jgi:hypothetical protein
MLYLPLLKLHCVKGSRINMSCYLVGYGGDGEEQGGSHRHSQGEGTAPHRYLNK